MKPKVAKVTKARQLEQLKTVLRKWLVVEDQSIHQAGLVLDRTKNPVIRLVMEILRQDSVMHKKVQQAILDSLEKEAFSLQPEELAGVWEMIEEHDEAEKEAVRLAEEARKSCPLVIQQQLLSYLIEDEKKHDRLLGNLEGFKKRLYPYG